MSYRVKNPEELLHRTVAELLNWVLKAPAQYTTMPSGWGQLNRATAGTLKACGLKAGWPDMLVVHDSRIIGIELKPPKGVLSDAQKDMHPKLRAAGMPIYVCYSIDDVIHALVRERVPMRPIRGVRDAQASDEIATSGSAA